MNFEVRIYLFTFFVSLKVIKKIEIRHNFYESLSTFYCVVM